ncbi:MAG: chorismate synthase [Alphaproteobacteria bacterium]
MSANTFGRFLTVTTWGESHGPAIGCVVDHVPPRIPLTEADLQPWLDRRRPGTSKFVTQRQEPDQVRILSGTYEGQTTGAPISLMIENVDARSKDYSKIAKQYRPGHADFSWWHKYGIRDPRGGGRSSARETAMRVAAGGIARKILGQGVRIRGALIGMGEIGIDPARWDDAEIDNNPFFCPDADAAKQMADYLAGIRKAGSSVGALIEVRASGVPIGLGDPTYGKLDADLAAACMSIHAVKGVEIGAGFNAARLRGEDNADEIVPGPDGQPVFTSNNAGGTLGGVSTGQDIVVRFAIKPTSSILIPRKSMDIDGNPIEIRTKGRHDPCVGIRAVPVGEAMLALVLADHLLIPRGQCGGQG